jgi:hypothetical protein
LIEQKTYFFGCAAGLGSDFGASGALLGNSDGGEVIPISLFSDLEAKNASTAS